jgi:hypothetical protein
LRRTIVAQIENGATVIRCSCNMQDHFVSELAIFELLTDVEASTLSLYCSLKERREVLADRMRHYCPGVGCSAIVSAAGVHDWQATCSSCNLKFCRTCYSEHSPALPCALVSCCYHHPCCRRSCHDNACLSFLCAFLVQEFYWCRIHTAFFLNKALSRVPGLYREERRL